MNAFLDFLKVLVFGLVEGFTEWLPISSTGHLILVENIVHLDVSENFMNVFRVVIQLGAILAVLVLYFRRLNPFDRGKTESQKLATWHLWIKIIIACFPAAVVGILLDEVLDRYLYNPYVVAAMLIIYGILFIVLEKHNEYVNFPIKKVSQISYLNAFYIGLFQLLALIPGTSRSGATILGAMLLGCSRTASSEFTFFLGIPVMFGASLLKIIHYGLAFPPIELFYMVVGMAAAFAVSMYSIQFLMNYVKSHDFRFFGCYRIILGIIVLIFQAVLLAHGGLTTLGANTFSMAIAGPLAAFGIYRLCEKLKVNRKVGIFLAALLGDLFTYCVTSVQLALAYPSESGGVFASAVKFLGVFAPTQLPLAVIEGILTVVIVIGLETYARPELKSLGFLGREKEAK